MAEVHLVYNKQIGLRILNFLSSGLPKKACRARLSEARQIFTTS